MAGLITTVCFLVFASIIGQGSSQSCQSCSDGWVTYNGNCYFFDVDQTYSWNGAMHYCASESSILSTIVSSAESDFVKSQLKKMFHSSGSKGHAKFWLAGADDLEEGTWVWYPSTDRITFKDWAPEQPGSTHGHNEDCLAMNGHSNFTWSDETCSLKAFLICKKTIATSLIVG